MNRKAIYPGTFDPVTNGHLDIIQRALGLFDEVIVAVAKSRGKSPAFTVEERVAFIKEAMPSSSCLTVTSFDILLTDFAKRQSANILIRGLRMVSDFEYEFQLASMNRHLSADIETVFLMPTEEYSHLSSSLVREIAALGGDVSKFVPVGVVQALKERLLKRE